MKTILLECFIILAIMFSVFKFTPLGGIVFANGEKTETIVDTLEVHDTIEVSVENANTVINPKVIHTTIDSCKVDTVLCIVNRDTIKKELIITLK